VRVAIITETFAPDLNGVAHSVLRAAEHLVARGHEPVVIAPQPAPAVRGVAPGQPELGYPVVRVPSIPMVGYPTFRIGLPSTKVAETLGGFAPDVVHLASPFALGAHGLTTANRMGLPSVAIYQTDVPRYAAGYGLGWGRDAAWRWLRRIHNAAERTLAPSSASIADLTDNGVERVHLWRRGVDTARFHPRHRDAALRTRLVRPGRGTLVGYVGRLAPEKRLDLLASVSGLPSVTLVIVGAGPERASLERLIPDAIFLGELSGHELAKVYASLDIFVHTGPFETFCQTIQEALASGVPVVGPDCGGPRDLVRSGRTGLLVRPQDAREVEAAVATLVAHDGYRARLAAAARPSVGTRSWSAVGDELIGHYQQACGERAIVNRLEVAA
jgi:phosphatidylinositol alpha 1,6-mannosyltransferase